MPQPRNVVIFAFAVGLVAGAAIALALFSAGAFQPEAAGPSEWLVEQHCGVPPADLEAVLDARAHDGWDLRHADESVGCMTFVWVK